VRLPISISSGRFVEWPAKAESDSFSFVCWDRSFRPSAQCHHCEETIAGKSVVAKANPRTSGRGRIAVFIFIVVGEHAIEAILTTLRDASVLTVSDLPEFTQRRGMVQFISEEIEYVLRLTWRPPSVAGLTLSSELSNGYQCEKKCPVRQSARQKAALPGDWTGCPGFAITRSLKS